MTGMTGAAAAVFVADAASGFVVAVVASAVSSCFFAAAVSAKCFSLICAARSFLFSSFCFSAVDSPLALAAEAKGAAATVRLPLPPSVLAAVTGLDLARSSARRALRAAALSCSSLSRCWLLMLVYLDAVDESPVCNDEEAEMALPLLPTEEIVLADAVPEADAAVEARPERTAGVLRADPTLDGGGAVAAAAWSAVN